MHGLLRAMMLTVAVSGTAGCAARSDASASARNEYDWVLRHACDCGPVAYAAGSEAPSWLPKQNYDELVRDKSARCSSRQFVVVAFGDGGPDLAGDMRLARARAAPFVHRLSGVAHRRLDTLVFAGPHLAHPSTLAIVCPADPLPGAF